MRLGMANDVREANCESAANVRVCYREMLMVYISKPQVGKMLYN
jgi:hypothetical protein